jgi:hypothetical protein
MNKDGLAEIFHKSKVSILVQGYRHGSAEQLHPQLERENSFGKPNKTLDEALAYQKICGEQGLNRFVVVYEKPTSHRTPPPAEEAVKVNLMNILYDYMKDYLGIQNDASGKKIATGPDESREDYVFKTLTRNTEGMQKIVLHVSRDMTDKETDAFYGYISKTAENYQNVKFLVLDQKERGIKKLPNFALMGCKE